MAKRKAYIAAIDHYPNPANNLPSCINDAKAFGQTIKEVYGFTDVRFDYDDKATLQNVETGLNWLFDSPGADDRLVFFFSGHGYQAANGQDLEEVLCLYDQFLFDNWLSQRTQTIPPGVFTMISDSCHSGGMYKLVAAGSQMEIAQTKVLKVPPIAEQGKTFLSAPALARLRYRPFGARLSSVSAIGKRFGLPLGKEFDEAGQLQMNGLLLSACLADETASASTARTGGQSAFTYALLEQLKALGPQTSNQQLVASTTTMLRQLGFRQTPVLMEPARPTGLGALSFLTFGGQSTPSTASDDWIQRLIESVLGNVRKEYAMTAEKSYSATTTNGSGDEKLWGLIANLAAVALPTVINALRKSGIEPQKEFSAVPGGEEKFWRSLISVIATTVPAVVDALRKSGYEPQKDFSGMHDEKSLGAIFRIVTNCMPAILRELTKQGIQPQKDFGGEEKFWGAIGTALSVALPAVLSALGKQGVAAKGFEDVPVADDKFFRAVGRIISRVAPLVLQALTKSGVDLQKDFQQDGQEKFFGALISVLGTVAPMVIQALAKSGYEPQKDFGGEEKFWGAFASVIQAALPVVIGALRKGDYEVGKSYAPTADASGDEKLWGTIARVIASAIPTIVGELTKNGAAVAGKSMSLPTDFAPASSVLPMPPDLVNEVVRRTMPELAQSH